MAVRPTRRTQPYRRGLATKMMGPANTAMMRGAPKDMQNPMDVQRGLAKRMSRIGVPPNPLKAADKVWKDAAGPTKWGPTVIKPPVPTQMIAGSRRKRKRPRTGSRGDGE